MDFQDKSLRCSDCGSTFTFSGGEQEFYQTNGFKRRCPACRQTKNGQRNRNTYASNSTQLQMFPVKDAECGIDTDVPFDTHGNKQYSLEIISKNQGAWLSQLQLSSI